MELEILKPRHSLAHLLAQAVQQTIDPNVALGTWPAVDDGFYYDVLFSEWITFGEPEMKELTKTMQWLVKQWQPFIFYKAKDKAEAEKIVSFFWEGARFKKELIEKFAEKWIAEYTFYLNTINAAASDKLLSYAKDEYTSIYKAISEYFVSQWAINADQFVTFVDLCEWPHVETTKEIDPGSFVLDTIAGAYWQAKETNPQMTRIYGLAFESKDALKKYQEMMEEAKKRDHRILWQKLKLFTLSELVGSGLPLFQPNGMIIRKEIEDYLWSLHKNRWYHRVWTPHLAKEDLYKVSWHAGHYLEDMFNVHGGTSKEDFYLKPMNCPHHMQLYADNQFSYRDMPIRYFEPATVYRDEKTWQLWGLTRVRSITQDDGHLFCRISQIHEEVSTVVKIIKEFYTTMGMMEWYWVRLSLRDDDKTKWLGTDEVWTTAESALTAVCDAEWLPYKEWKWEAAFYGPKLDFMFKDAIGREHQLATCQLDFNLPNRFELSFINEQGEKEQSVVIHRAISWSLERFLWVMIEHFAGAFPLWLAPTQIMFIPVAEVFTEHCQELQQQWNAANLRAKADISDDSFSKKIRNAELDKIPYIVIIGEKEVPDKSVSIRVYKTKEQMSMSADEFIETRVKEYQERRL